MTSGWPAQVGSIGMMKGELTKNIAVAGVLPDVHDQRDNKEARRGGIGRVGCLQPRRRRSRSNSPFTVIDVIHGSFRKDCGGLVMD